MFKKIRLINKLLELVGKIQDLAKKNKETVDEVFKILEKVKSKNRLYELSHMKKKE